MKEIAKSFESNKYWTCSRIKLCDIVLLGLLESLTDAEFVDVLSYARFIGIIGISLTSTELVDVLSYAT